MATQLSPSPVSLSSHRTSLPRKRKRRVRPPKDPDKRAVLHGGITVAGGLHLFSEIAAAEEALINTIEDVRLGLGAVSVFHSPGYLD